jgi:hypothetical protein
MRFTARLLVTASPDHEASRKRLTEELLNYDIQQSDIPVYLYHVTSRDRARKVAKQGLQVGKERETWMGHANGVYLTSQPEDLFRNDDFNPKDPWIFRVETRGLVLRFDPEFYADEYTLEEVIESSKESNFWMVFSTRSIPSSQIEGVPMGPRWWESFTGAPTDMRRFL